MKRTSPLFLRSVRIKGLGAEEVDAFRQGTYKTELCNMWEQSSECRFGDRCCFAHGSQDFDLSFTTLATKLSHARY
ncbi:Zinc finger CCCH domain-containing protein 9 [Nymphaea thermarum]|nr:Zinc finger CCCH domain-containing protein 9 [Nymphaea thermarum]